MAGGRRSSDSRAMHSEDRGRCLPHLAVWATAGIRARGVLTTKHQTDILNDLRRRWPDPHRALTIDELEFVLLRLAEGEYVINLARR